MGDPGSAGCVEGPELLLTARRISAGKPPQTITHFLVARVGVDRRDSLGKTDAHENLDKGVS